MNIMKSISTFWRIDLPCDYEDSFLYLTASGESGVVDLSIHLSEFEEDYIDTWDVNISWFNAETGKYSSLVENDDDYIKLMMAKKLSFINSCAYGQIHLFLNDDFPALFGEDEQNDGEGKLVTIGGVGFDPDDGLLKSIPSETVQTFKQALKIAYAYAQEHYPKRKNK